MRKNAHELSNTSSSIRTITVGPGVSPSQRVQNLHPVADYTASGDLHPALKTKNSVVFRKQYTTAQHKMQPLFPEK